MDSIAAYTVTIFGDLRDHNSAKEIIEWFKNKVDALSQMSFGIRNACITAYNERNGSANWAYDCEVE